MIVRTPTITSVIVMNSPKLSATITPNPSEFRFHNIAVDTAAPARPMIPSQPIGIFSPGLRKASIPIDANAARVTDTIGTIAAMSVLHIYLAVHHAEFRMQTLPGRGTRLRNQFDIAPQSTGTRGLQLEFLILNFVLHADRLARLDALDHAADRRLHRLREQRRDDAHHQRHD